MDSMRGADSMMDTSMEMSMSGGAVADDSQLPESFRNLRRALGGDFQPAINLTWRMEQAGARDDATMVDQMLKELLAVDPAPGARGPLIRYLRTEREGLDVQAGKLLDYPEISEYLLRRVAHLILSHPDAPRGLPTWLPTPDPLRRRAAPASIAAACCSAAPRCSAGRACSPVAPAH
jgi:hypothetical protein